MSVKVMTKVFENRTLTTGEKFVLVALADFGNDDGKSIYPSQSTIAEKTNMTRTSVNRILQNLEKMGYIKKTRRRSSGVYELEIVISRLNSDVAEKPESPKETPKNNPESLKETPKDGSESPKETPRVAEEHTIRELSMSKNINRELKDGDKSPSANPSEDYREHLRKEFPYAALGVPIKEKLDGVLGNLYDYPAHIQETIKAFSRKWRIPPPPKDSSDYSKWCKDATDVYKKCKNAQLSPEEVFKEAYYIWKTPPKFSSVPRELYEGNYSVYDMGSVSKLVWIAVSNILSGQRQRRVKVYTDANGKEIEIEQ
jgi:DNA-binding Lrp family transcriptional regulator